MLAIKYESLKKQNDDLRKVDENAAAVQRLKWKNRVARRAAKAAGFVEQAASAHTEYDAINALANYEANSRTKSYIVTAKWIHALDYSKFDTVYKILERDFLYEEPLTVGEYIALAEKTKPISVTCDCGEEITVQKKRESYANKARKIGDFWQFAFTIEDEPPKKAQKKTSFKRRTQTV